MLPAADTIIALTSRLSTEFKSVRTAIENATSYVRKENNGSDFENPNQVRVTIGAAPTVHTHEMDDIVGLASSLEALAPLVDAHLQGTPTAPTAALGENTNQVATMAAIKAAIENATAYVRKANNGSDFENPNQVRVTIGAAPAIHTHTMADITDLAPYLAAFAPLVDAHLQGTPTAPTAALGTNTTQIATMAAVKAAVDNLKVGAPALFDTLAKIGTWLDANDTELAMAISFKLDASAYTAADVLAKLKTVDGTGSGLDADLLDGQSGAYYLDLANSTNKLPATNFDDTSHGQRGGGNLHATATPTVQGFMLDAPNDGLGYMRKNGVWSPSTGGAHTDDQPPEGPLQDGQLWWKSSTGVMYLWYVEPGDLATAGQWVAVAGSSQIVDNNYTRKTAKQKNLVVNPTMQVSQENGNTVGATSNYYPADQWYVSASGLSFATARSQFSPSPDGSPNVVYYYFSAAKASLAAGDYSQLFQPIEGLRCAELQWGTSKAIPAVLRFSAFCDTAGTYTVSIVNPAGDFSWCGSFTCDGTQNLQTFSFAIPAQTAGTWPKDNTSGLGVRFCFAAGSNYQGVAGWQNGNKLAITGTTNGAAVSGKALAITDVGLHPDPDKTSLAPTFITPSYEHDLAACMRYYEKSYSPDIAPGTPTTPGSHQSGLLSPYILHFGAPTFRVTKRAVPTMTTWGTYNGAAGNMSEYNTGGTFTANRPVSFVALGQTGFEVQVSGGVGTQGNYVRFHWHANARM